jgi:hypothetical protein
VREVQVSADVARHLGAEVLERLRAHLAGDGRVGCWDCGQELGADEPAAAIVLLAPPGGADLDRGMAAHPRCRASGVYQLTASDLTQARARHGSEMDAQGMTTATCASGVVFGAPDGDRPILIIVFGDVSTYAGAKGRSDRVDLVSGHFLRRGWHLVSSLEAPPLPARGDWRLSYRMPSADAVNGGTLTLIAPDGKSEATFEAHDPEPEWLVGVFTRATCAVYTASLPPSPGHDVDMAQFDRDLSRGLVAAATLDVEFLDHRGRDARQLYRDVSSWLGTQN